MRQDHQRDCIEVLIEKARGGQINRRTFIQAMGLLAAVPLALAQWHQLVGRQAAGGGQLGRRRTERVPFGMDRHLHQEHRHPGAHRRRRPDRGR